MAKTIVLLATLDTKWKEVEFLKQLIAARGHVVFLIDVSMGHDSPIPSDISSSDIAVAGGNNIERVRELAATERSKASQIMTRGATLKVRELLDAGKLDGIIGIGGASNTTLATNVMKSLPFGVPKFMVSSVASVPAYASDFIGTKDITMMHSVVDISGSNDMVLDLLTRAGGAICGMAETGGTILRKGVKSREKPRIAVTEFGFCETAGKFAIQYLEERGYEPVAIHAQGIGDRAMEELIGQDFFDAVLDLVPAGVSEELLGGNRAAGPFRLEAAGRVGIPQVIAPSGFEMISCGPLSRRDKGDDPLWASKKLASRKLCVPDELRVQARTTKEELREIAVVIAKKLNKAKGPVKFLIPRRGWSNLSAKGCPLYEPESDKVFNEEIRKHLRPEVEVKELDVELDSADFALTCVEALLDMMKDNLNQS